MYSLSDDKYDNHKKVSYAGTLRIGIFHGYSWHGSGLYLLVWCVDEHYQLLFVLCFRTEVNSWKAHMGATQRTTVEQTLKTRGRPWFLNWMPHALNSYYARFGAASWTPPPSKNAITPTNTGSPSTTVITGQPLNCPWPGEGLLVVITQNPLALSALNCSQMVLAIMHFFFLLFWKPKKRQHPKVPPFFTSPEVRLETTIV